MGPDSPPESKDTPTSRSSPSSSVKAAAADECGNRRPKAERNLIVA